MPATRHLETNNSKIDKNTIISLCHSRFTPIYHQRYFSTAQKSDGQRRRRHLPHQPHQPQHPRAHPRRPRLRRPVPLHRQSKSPSPYYPPSAESTLTANRHQKKNQDRNVILSLTHEKRRPSPAAVQKALEERRAATGGIGPGEPAASAAAGEGELLVPWPTRYVGLVVVPGDAIVRIEMDEPMGRR